nr:hypothetical protein [Tanacetum cinerariifolium]
MGRLKNGNQANKNAGHQEVNGDTGLKKNVDVRHTKQEKVSAQQYIVFPLWSSISSSYKSLDEKAGDNTANDDAGKEKVQEPVKKVTRSSSTNRITTVSTPVNTASASRTFIPSHDSLMPELEDTTEIHTTGIFGNAYDEDDLETNNHSYADDSVELDMDVDISLVPPHAADQGRKSDDTLVSGQLEDQLVVFSAAKVLADAAEQGRSVRNVQTYTRQRRRVNTVSTLVSTADVSTASEMVNTVGLTARDKARKLHEEELARFNAEQESIDIARKEKVVAEGDQAHDIDWSDPAVIRYHTLQNRPRSVAKVRKSICIYLKNQGGFKLSHFKEMSYEDIRPIFKKVWDQIHSFVHMNSELEVQRSKRTVQEVERQFTEE